MSAVPSELLISWKRRPCRFTRFASQGVCPQNTVANDSSCDAKAETNPRTFSNRPNSIAEEEDTFKEFYDENLQEDLYCSSESEDEDAAADFAAARNTSVPTRAWRTQAAEDNERAEFVSSVYDESAQDLSALTYISIGASSIVATIWGSVFPIGTPYHDEPFLQESGSAYQLVGAGSLTTLTTPTSLTPRTLAAEFTSLTYDEALQETIYCA